MLDFLSSLLKSSFIKLIIHMLWRGVGSDVGVIFFLWLF